jgi:hypothetical protein
VAISIRSLIRTLVTARKGRCLKKKYMTLSFYFLILEDRCYGRAALTIYYIKLKFVWNIVPLGFVYTETGHMILKYITC